MHYITADGEITELNLVFKTPYNHDTLAEALRTAQVNDEPSKTQQHFKDEADINEIMRRWLKTGEIKEIPLPPQYGDFTEIGNRLPLTQQPHCRDQRTLLPPPGGRASELPERPGTLGRGCQHPPGRRRPRTPQGNGPGCHGEDRGSARRNGDPTVAEPPKPPEGAPSAPKT